MDTQQVVLQLADGSELTLEQTGEPFAFSALPNTAQEIEAAQHISELPNTGRTSITVLGAVRGVGGVGRAGALRCRKALPHPRRPRPQRELPYRVLIKALQHTKSPCTTVLK